jgi:hypothetical protein
VQGRAGIAIRILNRQHTVLWVIVSLSDRLILYPAKKACRIPWIGGSVAYVLGFFPAGN